MHMIQHNWLYQYLMIITLRYEIYFEIYDMEL